MGRPLCSVPVALRERVAETARVRPFEGEGRMVVRNPVGNMTEAVARFEQVLRSARVAAKREKHSVIWVRRFDAFRAGGTARSARVASEKSWDF